MRTVLNEKQLATLKNFYGSNPRPDAFTKEKLVELTQLSPRVIRVWFQNKRTTNRFPETYHFIVDVLGCKDKKRSVLAKQTQDHHHVLNGLHHGIPLVTSSPVPNDMKIGLPHPSLVQVQYHSGGPWKTYNGYPNGHYLAGQQQQQQLQRQTFSDLTGFASEDDSNCFDASQFSEERSDTSCDGIGMNQLTLL